ncbi:alanine--tRNA ligase [soil metagenome]
MPPPGLSAAEIRRTFIDFYAQKHAHTFVPSSPAVPHDDPTLLFANAGMNQFKPIFLGQADPSTPMGKLTRAVNSQKCIRAGGKHNDLEDVGKDTYHHTFFEMLGTWSFGDYFKRDSIRWGFELLTQVYGVDPLRLYATYFKGDPRAGLDADLESKAIWEELLGPARVLPGNMKDNFWEMGDTGPCGPCSEIHFDRIGERDASALVNSGDPDVLEIWNHVFIQFNREPGGALSILPQQHVDTGMGFERLVSVLQRCRSNYDTDVFAPLFLAIEKATRAIRPYSGRLGAADKDGVDTAYRVIADHIRTLTIAITDGATPGNEGRGYVLRRILRRAVRYGTQMLGAKSGFFHHLVPAVVQSLGDFFPELKTNPQRVIDIIKDEEESFGRTLGRGIILFDEVCIDAFKKARLSPHLQMAGAHVTASRDPDGWTLAIHGKDDHKVIEIQKLRDVTTEWADAHFAPARGIAAEDAFKLYDTFGFPIDLTALMAEERGLRVDMAGFERLMEAAKAKARAASKFGGAEGMTLPPDAIARLKGMGIAPTEDADKFHGREMRATIKAIWNGVSFDDGANTSTSGMHQVGLIVDRTNFYAEMGGQVADHGRISAPRAVKQNEDVQAAGDFKVEDVQAFAGYVVHIGRMTHHEMKVGDTVMLHVDSGRRHAVAANHTATHLLNLALRATLGSGVEQRGSMVAPDRLRFDFAHGKPVAPEEIAKLDADVGAMVKGALPVFAEVVPLEHGKKVQGVRAVFGEAYPDPVRVVSIGRHAADLIGETDADKAARTSAEFCGGTHAHSTKDIESFAIVAEEAVAKGIRRLVAITGVPARAAHQGGEMLLQRVQAAESLSGPDLAAEVKQILADVDQLTLPLTSKHRVRGAVATLQEKLKSAGKQASAAKAQEVVALARALADKPEYEVASTIVATIDAGSDREALAAAMNTVRAKLPRAGVLLVSPDLIENKLSIVAAVPETLIKRGLNAGDWVKAAATASGGKGGGKPDLAQAGGDPAKLKEALQAAKQYAFSKVPM